MNSASGHQPALRCSALVKRYGSVRAVDGVDLEVRAGECFGLLGPNGAGKTTTIEIFEGLTSPDEGTVEVLGHRWRTADDASWRERIGVQLQETQLPAKATVEEVIKLFRSFYRRGRGVREIIRTVELEEKRNARVEHLSGGQQQRLSLACALVNDPELLFLDEPTTGLDPKARIKLWDIIKQFEARQGTILLTTHYMEEAARLCDRVAILDHGRVIALDTPDNLVRSLGADQVVEFSVRGPFDEQGFEGLPGVRNWHIKEEGYVLTVSDIGSALTALLAEIARQRLELVALITRQVTLEDVFIKLTGRTLRDV